jgi:hypothetical protein
MKKAAIWFGISLAVLIAGLCFCLPGICGCVTAVPDRWQKYTTLPAILADGVGLIGCAVSGLLFLVLLAKHFAKKEGQAARAERGE